MDSTPASSSSSSDFVPSVPGLSPLFHSLHECVLGGVEGHGPCARLWCHVRHVNVFVRVCVPQRTSTSFCVCVHMKVCVCVYACLRVHVCVHVYMYLHMNPCVRVCVCMHVSVCVRCYAWTCACVCVCGLHCGLTLFVPVCVRVLTTTLVLADHNRNSRRQGWIEQCCDFALSTMKLAVVKNCRLPSKKGRPFWRRRVVGNGCLLARLLLSPPSASVFVCCCHECVGSRATSLCGLFDIAQCILLCAFSIRCACPFSSLLVHSERWKWTFQRIKRISIMFVLPPSSTHSHPPSRDDFPPILPHIAERLRICLRWGDSCFCSFCVRE